VRDGKTGPPATSGGGSQEKLLTQEKEAGTPPLHLQVGLRTEYIHDHGVVKVIQGNRWMLHLVYMGALKNASKRGSPYRRPKAAGRRGLTRLPKNTY
jgi:hypothetical protein